MTATVSDLPAKLRELLARIDVYLPTRTVYLGYELNDANPMDMCEIRWHPEHTGSTQISGAIKNDPPELCAKLGDKNYRFAPSESDEMVEVGGGLQGVEQWVQKTLWLHWGYKIEQGSPPQHIGSRFEQEFVRAITDLLGPCISSGALHLPWLGRHSSTWPRFLLRLGMERVHPLLKTSFFLPGPPPPPRISYVPGQPPVVLKANRPKPKWAQQAIGSRKQCVVYFEAHLSPDVRTATEIAVEYICGQLQAGQRLSTNITRGEPWSDDARGFKSAKEIIGQYDGKRPGRVQIVRLDYDKVRRFVTERHATEIAFMRNGRKLKIKSSDFERAFRRHWRELAQVDSADPDFIAKVTKMVGTLKESGAQTVKMWNCASCGNTAQSASRPSSCSKCGKNAMTTAKI